MSGEADPAEIDQAILGDMELVAEWLAYRDGLLNELYGRVLRRRYLREELLRRVMVEFGHGERRSISWYQGALRHMGSATAVAREATLMVSLNVLITHQSGRSTFLLPTGRLAHHFFQVERQEWRKWWALHKPDGPSSLI
jgi:hypothetical protein